MVEPRETSPFQTRKAASPWLNVALLAGLLIACILLIIVLAQRKPNRPPPEEPKREIVNR
jgi:hypothetical protein